MLASGLRQSCGKRVEQDSQRSVRFQRQTPARPSFSICARTPCQTVGTPHESCTFLGKHTGSRCTCSLNEATGTDAGIRGLAVPGLQLTLVQEVEPTPIRQALDICAARLPVSEHLKKRPWPGQTMAFEYELTSAEMAQLQHSPATCLHP